MASQKKKSGSKKSSEPKISFVEYTPPKPSLNPEKVKALETLMKDDYFKSDLGYKYDGLIEAFKCGQKCKKDK